MYKTVKLK